MAEKENREYLLNYLISENRQMAGTAVPQDDSGQWRLLRALMNVRAPKPANADFLSVQDEFLKSEIRKKGITNIDDLTPVCGGIYLWQGDITTLKCDAIVNAANSGLTGCYVPNHNCIDNCIHTYAGVQLRYECDEIIRQQGHEEPTGKAKITGAYNLPCKYVLHTVGPIIRGRVGKKDKALLKSCYTECLNLAEEKGLESIAFCCISTGVFHFPNDKAAEIAVATVKEFLKTSKNVKRVVFNVFKDYDREIYERLLSEA